MSDASRQSGWPSVLRSSPARNVRQFCRAFESVRGCSAVTALPYFDIAASGFSIRPASGGDAKACRMLLPAVSADASYFVAEDGMHGLVIVAAAVTNTCRPASLPGPGVMIHVIAPCRNYGIGSELCDASMREARSRGMQAIYAARKSPEESEETLGWRRLGFTPCETVEEHQMPLDQFVPRLEPLMARLRRLGRIPPEARIVPLYEADREQVLRLHLDHLGGDRESLCQRLSGRGSGAFHARYSRVLLAGHQVVGCILTHLQPPRGGSRRQYRHS